MPKTETTLERVREALEEELEFSNVTDLRQGFLGAVERLQKTPALRFLVLKHGRPQAVLMSFQTYELVKKVMNQVLAGSAGASREEAMQAAFERLQAGRSPARPEKPPSTVVKVNDQVEEAATAEAGKTYLGKVTRVVEFGAFVEILPGTEGLLHISEVGERRIPDIRDELKEGDQILVKALAVEGNRIRLSRKAILREQSAKMESAAGDAAEASKPSASKLAE